MSGAGFQTVRLVLFYNIVFRRLIQNLKNRRQFRLRITNVLVHYQATEFLHAFFIAVLEACIAGPAPGALAQGFFR